MAAQLQKREVTAIQTYLPKKQDKWPEKKVIVPKKGLTIQDFLHKVESVLTQRDYWLEDSKCNRVEHVSAKMQTVWIKSKVWCEVIMAYKERKANGDWPEANIRLPPTGCNKTNLLRKVDPDINPQDYTIEDAQSVGIDLVKPGISVVWVKYAGQIKVICQYVPRRTSTQVGQNDSGAYQWPQKFVDVPVGGLTAEQFFTAMDPGLPYWEFRVEDRSCKPLHKVTRQHRTVWVKRACTCLVIKTYQPKVFGTYPEATIDIPENGYSASELLTQIDSDLSTSTHFVEDSKRNHVDVIRPGSSTVWIKENNSPAVTNPSDARNDKAYIRAERGSRSVHTQHPPSNAQAAYKRLPAPNTAYLPERLALSLDSNSASVSVRAPSPANTTERSNTQSASGRQRESSSPNLRSNTQDGANRPQAGNSQHRVSNAQTRTSNSQNAFASRTSNSQSALDGTNVRRRRTNRQGANSPPTTPTNTRDPTTGHHTVTAIQTYLPKEGDLWPEFKVQVPSGGMELRDFLHAVDHTLTAADYWLEDSKCNRLDRVPEPGPGNCTTVWIKSKVWCEVIQAYLPKKDNGDWPEENIRLPPHGYDKATLLSKIDANICPEDYIIEDAQSNQVSRVDPGLSVVWVKRAGQIKVICQYLPKTARLKWIEKCVEIPEEGLDIPTFFRTLDPELDSSRYRVENRTCKVLDRVSRDERMVWVKQNTTCLVIQTYLPKRDGVYPEVTFELPKFGYSVEEFFRFVDSSISPDTHYAEDSRRRKLQKIRPGISTIWIKGPAPANPTVKPPVNRGASHASSTSDGGPTAHDRTPVQNRSPPSSMLAADPMDEPGIRDCSPNAHNSYPLASPPRRVPVPVLPPVPLPEPTGSLSDLPNPVSSPFKPPASTKSSVASDEMRGPSGDPNKPLTPETVFISYNHTSCGKVEQLKKILQEKHGVRSCMDLSRLGGGQAFRKQVEACMRASEVVVCCVTQSYLRNQNCLSEAALSLELDKTLVVALMENMPWPPKELAYIFENKKKVNITEWVDSRKPKPVKELAAKIKKFLRAKNRRPNEPLVPKPQEEEKSAGQMQDWSREQVVEWVSNLGTAYAHYGKYFEYNGIDGQFLAKMDQKDLNDLGVHSRLHQKKILREIQRHREDGTNILRASLPK